VDSLLKQAGYQPDSSARNALSMMNFDASPPPLPLPAQEPQKMIQMVDAAMIEMRNITPPLRRSECERLIRAALSNPPAAQSAQEPVAFDSFLESQDFYELMQTYRHCQIDAHIPFEAVKDALRAVHTETAWAQPAQEPYCYVDPVHLAALNTHQNALVTLQKNPSGYASRGLYTTPPKREWVGLNEDDIRKLYGKDLNYRDGDYMRYAKSIEAKLKEKNT
jgi:hypothetical protein